MEIKDNMYLGKLCKFGHEYKNTGKSVRYKFRDNGCVQCKREYARKHWRQKRDGIEFDQKAVFHGISKEYREFVNKIISGVKPMFRENEERR